jgi:Ca2+-binding EF-hand superfamily protein
VHKLLIFGLIAAISVPAAAQQKAISRADYLKQVDASFAQMDTNHDGIVSKAELAAEQQRELAQAKAAVEQRMRAIFTQLDTNHDGQLSFQEFLASAPPVRTSETPDQMMQALDTNHDGKISIEEYRGPRMAKFNKLDTNHDGVVTPAEMQAGQGTK